MNKDQTLQNEKQVRLLVVEDLALNQLLMKALLHEFGFDLDIASNGKIAIEKLKENSYDLVLMDLQMPEMNGIETTHHIRNTLKLQVPIIALTADISSINIEKCKDLGMNDYISKPIDEKILYQKITSFVGSNNNSFSEYKKTNYKHIGLDYIEKLTLNNPESMTTIINAYLEEIPKLLQIINRGLENRDWQTIGATVHNILPSFSMVGIDSKYETLARKVEEHCEKKEKFNEVKELCLEIEHICNAALLELQQEVNRLKKI